MRHVPRLALVVLVLLLYFGSETLLRNRVHPVVLGNDVQAQALIDNLPAFVRGYVKHRRDVRAVRDRLENTTETEARLALLMELAGLLEGRQRRAVLRQVSEQCADLPGAALAVAEVATADEEPAAAVSTYLAFIERCQPADGDAVRQVWHTGWQMVREFPPDARYAYLKPLAATGLLDPALAPAWTDLRGLAVRRGDEEMLARAKRLERESRALAAGKTPDNAW